MTVAVESLAVRQRWPLWRLALKLLLRDGKSGELLILGTALIIAVASLTAVAFLADRVGQAVQLQAAASLAGDLRLESRNPLPDTYLSLATEHSLDTAAMTSLPSVVLYGDANTLVSLRAVTTGYPLRGQLKLAKELTGEAAAEGGIPQPGEAWAAPRLLARLGADAGAEITVGSMQLKVTRVLVSRPDEGWSFTDLAPTLLINSDDLPATGLVQPGSRVSYRLLFAGEREQVGPFREAINARLAPGEDLDGVEDSGPQLRSATDRAKRFLNLASLISALLSMIAVAMASRRYAHRHRDRVALLKCLGASRATVFRTSVLQLLILALAGAFCGTLIGYAAQAGLAFLLRDFIAEPLPLPGLAPAGLGLMTALSILAGFVLPDLARMGRTPPLRVLRHDVGPPPWRGGLGWIIAVLSVLTLLAWLFRDARLVGTVVLGTGLTFVVLGAAGWLLVRALQGLRGAGGGAWRQGLANVARRGRESVAQVVAFGLGIMVLLLLTLVRNDLLETWRASMPVNAPNRFMINIQPHEVEPLRSFLAENGIEAPRFVPMIRARFTSLNDEDITQVRFEDPQGERWARRESNLSFADEMQADNKLTAGRWWEPGTTAAEISVEQDFATEMGLKIGDRLGFDIAGEALEATVTSFRTVEWDSFRPNFFMVLTPAALEGYPGTWINSLHAGSDKERVMLELMRKFPAVTVVDLDAVLTQVRAVMDKAALAVQAVFLFTLLAGCAVLWAAVQATRDEREFESAMLRALGASRRRVLAGSAFEFLAIGLLAGLLATAGAMLAGWFLATDIYELEWQFNLPLALAGPLAGMGFVGLTGLLATRRIINTPPLTVLRRG